ncbi:MAG: H(+)/Cl(-) exchange transporter ClcA [Anaerolineales bacterium]|nr:H(+)/Cl(-) exchange transporter ClcA [Anaerolineales bacterium]
MTKEKSTEVEEEVVRSEIQEYLYLRQQRRRLFPLAALVGLCAGIVAILFRGALSGADTLRNLLITKSHEQPIWGWIFPILFSVSSATLSLVLVRRYAPEAKGSGIPFLEAVLQRIRELKWSRILPVKFFGGILAIGSGLALGREGPTVQMGGAVGAAIADGLKVSPRERLTLISAGAGAGLAAAFNAPLSGLVFVLEEVQRDFHPIVFGAAFLAAAVADVVARIGADPFPVFSVPKYLPQPIETLPAFAILGIVAGVLGVFFNRSLVASLELYGRMKNKYLAVAVTGALIGLIGWFSPMAIGNGHPLAEMTLSGKIALTAIPLWFTVRFLLTVSSYGTGVPGGIFAPLLVLGALIGLAVGKVAVLVVPSANVTPAAFAVVGMAAYFIAIVRAPLTGVVLIIEMTGNYEQMLPLLISCFFAYAVAEYLKDLPIYEVLLERDLLHEGDQANPTQPIVMDFTIQEGAPFDGKPVHALGLPAGCILVRCSNGRREWVPKANTRLEANMRITAVIEPEASHGLSILRHGCEASYK